MELLSKRFMEIIKLINSMNKVNIQIEVGSDAERLSIHLLFQNWKI
jgi:hypothetical protein